MLTIYSLNANGLRNFEKIREIFTSCEIYNCDILCIQETFWNDAIIPEVSKLWEGKIFFNNYDISNRKGVAILMKKNINATIKNIVYGEKGRLLKITIEHFDKIINVFSIYAPNDQCERKIFLNNCRRIINKNEINILGGDFNDYLDILLDRSHTMTSILYNNKYFQSFLTENDLVDIWRDRNPDKRVFSRKQWVNGILKQSRIDYIFISRNCMPYTSNCFYKLSSVSDHSYICMKFDFSQIERGPGMWIFNNTLLNDQYFCTRKRDKIRNNIQCPLYQREQLVW